MPTEVLSYYIFVSSRAATILVGQVGNPMPLTLWHKGGAGRNRIIFFLDFFAAGGYSLLDGTLNTTSLEIDKTALDALALFQAALPAEFFERQRKAAGKPPEKGVYTAPVVV